MMSQLEFIGNNMGEERAILRNFSRNLHESPLESVTKELSADMLCEIQQERQSTSEHLEAKEFQEFSRPERVVIPINQKGET